MSAIEPRVIRCPDCGLPVARLYGTILYIVARHHGEKHVVMIDLEQLHSAGEAHEKPPAS